jgi:Protein of unknown function (DUF1659).
MAVNRQREATTLSIEVKSGTNAKGETTYSKKSFPNLRADVVEQNAYDVAEAIKAVLSAPTKSYFINKTSNLFEA